MNKEDQEKWDTILSHIDHFIMNNKPKDGCEDLYQIYLFQVMTYLRIKKNENQ